MSPAVSSYVHVFEPGTDDAAPPLLLLHGTGGNEHDLLGAARELSPGSAFLSPRGDVLENGQPRFFRRFVEGGFDLDDVERRADALAEFVAAAAQHYGFARDRLLALGFSNGANMAASLLLRRPETLAGAVLLRPMVVLEPQHPAARPGRAVLIAAGARDPIVPPDHPPRLAAMLRTAGAEVDLRTHPAGHGLVPADFAAARHHFDAARRR